MKMFKNCEGYKVDLDDMGTYPEAWKRMDIIELFPFCMKEAGKSLFYMEYLNVDVNWGDQKKRVDILCRELVYIWQYVRKHEDEYRASLLSWLYRFQDEVENQC